MQGETHFCFLRSARSRSRLACAAAARGGERERVSSDRGSERVRERDAHDESDFLLRSASTTWCLLRLGRASRSAGRRGGEGQPGGRAGGRVGDAPTPSSAFFLCFFDSDLRVRNRLVRRALKARRRGGRTSGRRTPLRAPAPARLLAVPPSPPRSRPRGSRISEEERTSQSWSRKRGR